MAETSLSHSKLGILVVEDDAMLNLVMCVQLKVSGFSGVRSATSGQQALQMIRESVPSVLILDIGLPDMSGQQVIAELRQNSLTRALPLIVHTSADLSNDEKTQLQLGPSRFVTKSTAFSERLTELIFEVTELEE
jgi:CheY-like chemotaxis protein